MYRSLVSKVLIVLAIASTLTFYGCPPEPITQEQLNQLKELRDRERDLQSKIKSKQDEISNLERELASRKAELQNCQKETEFVKGKLANWPDVWPDWKPEAQKEKLGE